MRVDVLLGEAPVVPADVADRVVVVLDVLRAATTVATALAHGARAVVPFETVDEVAARVRVYARGEVLTAGERRMQRISGFDLGNSPLEFTPEVLGGRTVLFTTTNGTVALTATAGARACFFAGFVNAQATVQAVLDALGQHAGDVTIVCAGHERRLAFEDVVCAGRLVRLLHAALPGVVRGDGARVAELAERPYVGGVSSLAYDAQHARSLADAGFSADVSACLALDTFSVATAYVDRQLLRATTGGSSAR